MTMITVEGLGYNGVSSVWQEDLGVWQIVYEGVVVAETPNTAKSMEICRFHQEIQIAEDHYIQVKQRWIGLLEAYAPK